MTPVKLREILRFELAYQLRRPWTWLFFAVLLVLSFLMARDTSLSDALYEEFFANSPFAIAKTTVFGGLAWLLLAPAVAGEAAARDVATGMYPLVYTASVRKADYLGGRFLAALLLNAALLLAVPLGVLLGVYSPGVAAEVIGPFRPAAYLGAYAFLALPNAIVGTAVQFALALRTGRAMAGYGGSLLLVFVGFFVATLVRFTVAQQLGMLLDPIGVHVIVEDLAHQWTTAEKSTRLLALDGLLLRNRLLWLGVGLTTLAVTYARFRFAHRVEGGWWAWGTRRRSARAAMPNAATAEPAPAAVPRPVPRAARTFGLAFHARQTLAIAWTSFRAIAVSWAGLALLVAVPTLTVLVVIDQMVALGTPLVPTTPRVLAELTAPLSAALSRWVIVPLAIAFFAGELVWRERDAGSSEITDAMPGSEWAPFVGKLLGLALVLAVLMALLAAAGMVAQATRGHHDFEVGLYLTVLFGLQLPEYLLFAVLALAVHAVVNQKYVGHLAAILAYVFIAVLAGMLGIEHSLLVYGAGPAWSYTPMRGFAGSLGPWAWLKAYWAAWALLLAVAARLLWVRGTASAPGVRLALARRRFARATRWTAAAGAGLVVALGGFVFYNTNVLNAYRSTAAAEERRAEYERRYRRYESAPQPRLTGTRLRVEIYPERRAVELRGSYRLVNATARPIDSVHVGTATGRIDTRALRLNRPATLALRDDDHGHRIYALATPLRPGDSLRLDFDVRVERRGFGNRGVDPSVAAKGSYFTAGAWLPLIGYQRFRELLSPAARREHGLAPRAVLASVYEVEGGEPTARGGGIAFEAIVGTAGDQFAVAPGALRRTWTENGRRYFDYATSAPIGDEWAFFSARYQVREERHDGVTIRLYHDPAHTAHLDRMLRSVRASLDYYGAQFGRYPYSHLTVVENPAAPGTGAHADASVLSYGQGYPFWIPPSDRPSLDFPSAVLAHEMAHQWTLPYALAEGLPFLSEGLAWYSAMQVTRASRGDAELRRLLAFMRQPYPFRLIRRGEPLLRALDPYLAYRKGPFAMYALSEYIGADRVNGALRQLIETHDAPGASLATTLDLYRELQRATPDSLKPLLHDLFEVNTFWDLATERASATQLPNGSWQVTLAVRARKTVADSAGAEREVPMRDWIEIGVFGEGPAGDALGAPLYVQKHRLRAGERTITVTVPRRPALAGVDPRRLLDVAEGEDNVAPVTVEPARRDP